MLHSYFVHIKAPSAGAILTGYRAYPTEAKSPAERGSGAVVGCWGERESGVERGSGVGQAFEALRRYFR